MKKIKFKTIKNSNIEIFCESNKNYSIKDIKKLIETQYGWDHKKLKIYKDKYDINSLLNDDYPFPLDLYLKKNSSNFYYLKNYRYIPINIYEEKKDDDSSIEFDFDKFCSNESSSNKTKNNDNNPNSKNNTNINDNNIKINKTNNENNNNKKNESKNKTDNNNNINFQKGKSEIIQNSKSIPPKIKKTSSEEIFTENENQKIEELIDFTGCTRDKAIKALKMTKWDLNEAGNIIFDI